MLVDLVYISTNIVHTK